MPAAEASSYGSLRHQPAATLASPTRPSHSTKLPYTGFAADTTSPHDSRVAAAASASRPNTLLKRPQSLASMASPPVSQSAAVAAKAAAAAGVKYAHKRVGSASSLSTLGAHQQIHSPFSSTFSLRERRSSECMSTSPSKTASSLKIKPLLRKMSLQHEQGGLDLSRTAAENEMLTGVDMHDFTGKPRRASDVVFHSTVRRGSQHVRTASVVSQMSGASATPTQPFVHPWRQEPRAYERPCTRSESPTLVDDEAREQMDVLPIDTFSLRQNELEPWRSRRSFTTISTAQTEAPPTSRLRSVQSMIGLGNGESTRSSESIRSGRSSKSHVLTRSRGNTNQSLDAAVLPSTRTSVDKAFSLLSNTSEPEDAATRAASIRAARRAFEEKELAKDRKAEKEQLKRQDAEETKRVRQEQRVRRRSSLLQPSPHDSAMDEKLSGREYMTYAPQSHAATAAVRAQGDADEGVPPQLSKTKVAKGGWVRFVSWSRTRLLSCA